MAKLQPRPKLRISVWAKSLSGQGSPTPPTVGNSKQNKPPGWSPRSAGQIGDWQTIRNQASRDRSQGGSFWPAFGDRLHSELRVPIGVATTGYGCTSVNQWQPDGDLFQRWFLTRIHQLGPGGFRAVLWHQGESDVKMPSTEYFAKLKNTILASIRHAGWEFPWFVALTSYHNPQEPRFETVRSAQQRICDEGYALPGPDTDVLTGDHRDFDGKGIHFSPKVSQGPRAAMGRDGGSLHQVPTRRDVGFDNRFCQLKCEAD